MTLWTHCSLYIDSRYTFVQSLTNSFVLFYLERETTTTEITTRETPSTTTLSKLLVLSQDRTLEIPSRLELPLNINGQNLSATIYLRLLFLK